MKLVKRLFLTIWFFAALIVVIILFAASYSFPSLFFLAQGSLIVLTAITMLDVFLLFNNRKGFSAKRYHAKVLSMGDDNTFKLELSSLYNFKTDISIIEELPEQLQERNFNFSLRVDAYGNKKIKYSINPKSRGEYHFGAINIFVQSPLRLTERHIVIERSEMIPVYPSIIQMKNFELKAISSISHFQGIKKIRKIGHSYEFEQLKQYVPGDDTRSINWKASSRAPQLMVNHYEDERSQPVYSIIDKSRIMRMPFNRLSLLDYSINASLVISNIALRKHDKAGLLTFNNKLGNFIKAERTGKQLNKILYKLYNERVNWVESDYELLYSAIRNFIKGRSLIFLFTNFESTYALERVLPILRKINKMHLLVVMFFENTELIEYSENNCDNLLDIYKQTAAKELILHKEKIVQILKMHGIQCIKTKPENLSLDTVNKYLELKARGYI